MFDFPEPSVIVVPLIIFAVLALAARQIGAFATRYRLPLISGYLLAGILVGPYVLDLIHEDAVEALRFVDEVALGFIAISAGSELYLRELRGRLKSIAWVTLVLTAVTFVTVSIIVYLLASTIPFMRDMSPTIRVAVAILVGAIMVARSPSSAIAIINELRAKGPFTKTAIGVTIVTDVVVIILFAINSSIADLFVTGEQLGLGFLILLVAELAAAIALGVGIYFVLRFIINLRISDFFKTVSMLTVGYAVFVFASAVRIESHLLFGVEFFLEPLLILMVSGFMVANYSGRRLEFIHLIEYAAPVVFLVFFTLTGAELQLDVLADVWLVALIIVVVRMASIFVGAFVGGTLAREPRKHNRVAWMVYITQAGVGLGLAKEVGVEFPEWGAGFITLLVGVIVINQLIGPPLFKYAISRVGEAHPRAQKPEFDGEHDAVIFGIDNQSRALARQLLAHNWGVLLVACATDRYDAIDPDDIQVRMVNDYSAETLRAIGVQQAETVVVMLHEDDDNYRVCETIYERFGTSNIIVRINDDSHIARFTDLNVTIVDPRMTMVHLLDQFVRSPAATSLLLGMVDYEEVRDIEVIDPALDGVPLRELQLPQDALILSIQRDGEYLVTHGYTTLKHGDRVSVLGTPESLEVITLRFEVSG